MIASGAQLAIFTTGEGNPYGSAIAPTIKISANPKTIESLHEQIDFDVSAVFAGTRTIDDLLPHFYESVYGVSNGDRTWAEVTNEQSETISRLNGSI